MNGLLEIVVFLGFGGAAWELLVFSDWLMGERRPTPTATDTIGSRRDNDRRR